MEQITFTISGKPPSKKNMWHPSKHGGIYADKKVGEFVDYAYLEIKSQLKKWKTITGPVELDVCFLMDDRSDMDNCLSMIWDLLQKIELIKNDRQIRRCFMRREKVKPNEAKTIVQVIYKK